MIPFIRPYFLVALGGGVPLNSHVPGDSLCPFLGWLSEPLERLSDLQLGDEKVTLNHLVWMFFIAHCTEGKSGMSYISTATF